MKTTIDKEGRVVIPIEICKRLGLSPGTELDVEIDGFSLKLVPAAPAPELSQRHGRLVARPQARKTSRPKVDVAHLIEDERDRWP